MANAGNPSPQSPPARPSFVGRALVAVVYAALYVTALACPALVFRRSTGVEEVYGGLQCAAVGALGLFVGQVAWYAHVPLLLALVLLTLRKYLLSAALALFAALVGLLTLTLHGATIPADEGGEATLTLLHTSAGFHFWLASMVWLALGAVILRIGNR